MTTALRQRWQFAGRFRRNAFGWRSQPAIQRAREAVLEIKKVFSLFRDSKKRIRGMPPLDRLDGTLRPTSMESELISL